MPKNTMNHTITMKAAVAACVTTATGAIAQDVLPKAPPQENPVAIVGATIHPVSGPAIENAVILFEDGEITRIASRSGFRPARGTEVIEADDHHVYPGLFAAATILGISEIASIPAYRDFSEVGQVNPEVRAAAAVNPDSALIPVARLNGILLAGSYPRDGLIPGRASVIRMDGWTWEDMAVDSAAGEDAVGLVVDWPRGRPIRSRFIRASVEEQRRSINENIRTIDSAFRSAMAYRDAKQAGDAPTDIRLEAMQAYIPGDHNNNDPAPVLVQADDIDQITAAVAWAAELGIDIVIVGGRDADMAAELLVAHEIPVIIGGNYPYPKRPDSAYDERYSLPKRLHEAGVKFAIRGTEQGDGNDRNLPYEAAHAARHGLPIDATIRAITLAPAEIYEIDDRYGSLDVGKSATLIVTTGNPLEVTTEVTHAWIDGRRVLLESKQTQLRDKYVEKYQQLDLIDE